MLWNGKILERWTSTQGFKLEEKRESGLISLQLTILQLFSTKFVLNIFWPLVRRPSIVDHQPLGPLRWQPTIWWRSWPRQPLRWGQDRTLDRHRHRLRGPIEPRWPQVVGSPTFQLQTGTGSILVGSFDIGLCWKPSKKVTFTQKVSVH